MNYSKTFAAAIVSVLVGLSLLAGRPLPEDKVEAFVDVSLSIFTILTPAYIIIRERIKKGGVHWFGKKHDACVMPKKRGKKA
jgi:hypothetical protein